MENRGREMDELIIESLQGNATEAEEAALRAWRRASLDNEARYRALAQIWELTGAVSFAAAPTPPAAEIIAAAEADTSVLHLRPRGMTRAARWLRWGAAAAAVVAIGLALGRWLAPQGEAGRSDVAVYTTGPGDMRTVKLADGSVIRLAGNTVVRFRNGAVRDAWLEGQAFFAVAERGGSPFIVRTRGGEARVLGTRFALTSDDRGLKLVVVEGRVELAANEGTVQVAAGEGTRVVDGRRPVVQPIPDVHEAVSWLGDVLIFQDTPLAQAIAEVEQHYGVSVVLADSTVRQRTVTAVFTDQDFSQVFTTICRVVDLNCTRTATGGAILPE